MPLNYLLLSKLHSDTVGLLNMQVHDLLKLYDRVDVSPERLLFKIPSTWQVSIRKNYVCGESLSWA